MLLSPRISFKSLKRVGTNQPRGFHRSPMMPVFGPKRPPRCPSCWPFQDFGVNLPWLYRFSPLGIRYPSLSLVGSCGVPFSRVKPCPKPPRLKLGKGLTLYPSLNITCERRMPTVNDDGMDLFCKWAKIVCCKSRNDTQGRIYRLLRDILCCCTRL